MAILNRQELSFTVGVKKVSRSNMTCKASNFEVRLLLSYFKVTSALTSIQIQSYLKLLERNFSITFVLLNLQVRLFLSTFLTPIYCTGLLF